MMISVLPTQIKKFRSFGWVQDPSNLISLCNVVAVFDSNSQTHKDLIDRNISKLVEKRDGRDTFINTLKQNPLKIPYSQLVGTSFTPRSSSRCNGIIQVTVKGQGRDFIGDWPADNFVRWAHCFGFIKYNYNDDTFEITNEGLALSAARNNPVELSESEKALLIDAALAYSPAIRILKLLSATEDTHLTKFEIGKQLGFIGEDGFTSMPQKILIQA
ncbi:MAG: restriction endonuclease FokI recognition domain-containing protein, partial [Oscillospiraceae bacterium]